MNRNDEAINICKLQAEQMLELIRKQCKIIEINREELCQAIENRDKTKPLKFRRYESPEHEDTIALTREKAIDTFYKKGTNVHYGEISPFTKKHCAEELKQRDKPKLAKMFYSV